MADTAAVTLPDYPTAAQAMLCFPVVLAILKGQVAVQADAKALWILTGYGLSILLTAPAQPASVFQSHAEAASHIEAELGKGLSGINWGGLLKTLLPILLGLLTK